MIPNSLKQLCRNCHYYGSVSWQKPALEKHTYLRVRRLTFFPWRRTTYASEVRRPVAHILGVRFEKYISFRVRRLTFVQWRRTSHTSFRVRRLTSFRWRRTTHAWVVHRPVAHTSGVRCPTPRGHWQSNCRPIATRADTSECRWGRWHPWRPSWCGTWQLHKWRWLSIIFRQRSSRRKGYENTCIRNFG